MSSNPNEGLPDQEAGGGSGIPLLASYSPNPAAAIAQRRTRSMWVFGVLMLGVLGYLIYSSIAIVHDATSADYGWQEIDKPANDPKIYKYLDEVLPNGPPIVMVQDPGAQLTGFAIGVSAGSFYDPMDYPGLAHFTEHMLFLGTRKYPKATEFDEFMSSHGGSSNAFTDSERTVFYNSIDTDAFVDGFSRFVEFFNQPTFNSTYIEKEVNAVDSEHAMHMNDVHWRMYSLVASLTLPPANHYGTGDSSTLLRSGNNTVRSLQEAVTKYYSSNYCFNRLSIAIVSPLAISDQIEIVRDAFNSMSSPPMAVNCVSATNFTAASAELTAAGGYPIPAWNREKIVYSQAPHGVAPQVWIVFPNQGIVSHRNQGKQPYGILDTIITFAGQGSFKETVLSSGLATSVNFMYDDTTAGSLGYLGFSLSESGVGSIPELLELTFSFLQKVRSAGGVDRGFIDSLAMIRGALFDSSSDVGGGTPMKLSKFFASEMTTGVLHANELITRTEKILETDVELVNKILGGFVVENTVVVVHDPAYVSGSVPAWLVPLVSTNSTTPEKTDPHYDFNYTVFGLDGNVTGVWAQSAMAANVTVLRNITVLPPKSMSARSLHQDPLPDFPDDGVVNATPVIGAKIGPLPRVNLTQVLSPPVRLYSGNGTEVWYKDLALGQGTEKIYLWASIRPAASAMFGVSPEEAQFNGELLTDCLNAGFRTKLANYALAGYEFHVNWMFAGYVEVRVSGWAGDEAKAMMGVILKEIASPSMQFYSLVLSEKTEQLSRPRSVADLAGDAMNALTVGSATNSDLLNYVNTYSPITKDSLVAWANTTFAKVYTTVYISGASSYLSQVQALEIGLLFSTYLGRNSFVDTPNGAVSYVAGPRYVKPVEVRMANPVVSDPNSALLYSLTYGTDMSAKDRILAALLSSILAPWVFRYIRTENQMGYIASCRTGVYPGPAGAVQLRVFIQGNQATPDMMEARLEELFITQVPDMLQSLPLGEVADRAAGLAASLEETPTSAYVEASMYWPEIQNENPCFQRTMNQAKFLETTDATTLKQGIIDVFNAFTYSRRSLVSVKLWQSQDGTSVANVDTWSARDVSLTLNNTSVSKYLASEKSRTMFVPSVTKTVRELVFQRALNTTDPMWTPVIPTCDV